MPSRIRKAFTVGLRATSKGATMRPGRKLATRTRFRSIVGRLARGEATADRILALAMGDPHG